MTDEQIRKMTEEEERNAPPPAVERDGEWSWEILAEFIEGVLGCAVSEAE